MLVIRLSSSCSRWLRLIVEWKLFCFLCRPWSILVTNSLWRARTDSTLDTISSVGTCLGVTEVRKRVPYITRSRLVLRLPSNSLCYREIVAKIFCNNGESFRNNWQAIYGKIKTLRKALNTGWTLKKVSEWKKLRRKLKRVRKRCPWPNTVAVLWIQKLSNFALHVIEK